MAISRHGLAALVVGALMLGSSPAKAQEAPLPAPGPMLESSESMEAGMIPDEAEVALADMDEDLDGAAATNATRLTDDQKSRLKDIMQKHRRELIRLRGQMALQRFDLGVALGQVNPSPSQVNQLAESLNSTRNASEMEKVHMIMDLKSVLTPEQQKRFMGMMRGRHGRRGHGGWHGGGHHGGPGGGGWQHHGRPGGGDGEEDSDD